MGLLGWLLPRRRRIALLVDGPNVFRAEFDIDLQEILQAVRSEGELAISRLYLDEHASPGLIRAAEMNGFEVVITSGDVDVKLAVDGTEIAATGRVEVLSIASRDGDFKPVFERAGYHGLQTLAIAPGNHGRSEALVNAADEAIVLGD